jgi:hypothetical protein
VAERNIDLKAVSVVMIDGTAADRRGVRRRRHPGGGGAIRCSRNDPATPTICSDAGQRLKSVDGSHMLHGITHLHERRHQGRSLFAIIRNSTQLLKFNSD